MPATRSGLVADLRTAGQRECDHRSSNRRTCAGFRRNLPSPASGVEGAARRLSRLHQRIGTSTPPDEWVAALEAQGARCDAGNLTNPQFGADRAVGLGAAAGRARAGSRARSRRCCFPTASRSTTNRFEKLARIGHPELAVEGRHARTTAGWPTSAPRRPVEHAGQAVVVVRGHRRGGDRRHPLGPKSIVSAGS